MRFFVKRRQFRRRGIAGRLGGTRRARDYNAHIRMVEHPPEGELRHVDSGRYEGAYILDAFESVKKVKS